MVEEDLFETLTKKTGLTIETLHNCVNALALIMAREFERQRFFDMPEVGRLVLGDPVVPPGPLHLLPESQQPAGTIVMQGGTLPRISYQGSFFKLPPTGLVSPTTQDTTILGGLVDVSGVRLQNVEKVIETHDLGTPLTDALRSKNFKTEGL